MEELNVTFCKCNWNLLFGWKSFLLEMQSFGDIGNASPLFQSWAFELKLYFLMNNVTCDLPSDSTLWRQRGDEWKLIGRSELKFKRLLNLVYNVQLFQIKAESILLMTVQEWYRVGCCHHHLQFYHRAIENLRWGVQNALGYFSFFYQCHRLGIKVACSASSYVLGPALLTCSRITLCMTSWPLSF